MEIWVPKPAVCPPVLNFEPHPNVHTPGPKDSGAHASNLEIPLDIGGPFLGLHVPTACY